MEREIILAVLPLALIQLGLMVFCLVDISKRSSFRLLPKVGWVLVVIFINLVGPVLYLTMGRDYGAA